MTRHRHLNRGKTVGGSVTDTLSFMIAKSSGA